jgi:hypothetical protein
MKHIRLRTALRGLAMTVAVWTFLALLVEYLGATWPHATISPTSGLHIGRTEAWFNFALLIMVVEFLWLKSWMMGAFTNNWDGLGSALITANIAFSALYLYFIGQTLFPHLTRYRAPTYCLRGALVVALIWGLVQLILVPDPDEVTT